MNLPCQCFSELQSQLIEKKSFLIRFELLLRDCTRNRQILAMQA